LRDKDAAAFVHQFNAFRTAAKQKARSLEGELLRVFSHAKALAAVVARIEAGAYAVRQRGASSRVVVPCIPPQDRPVRSRWRGEIPAEPLEQLVFCVCSLPLA
jgi:hypothetical protein